VDVAGSRRIPQVPVVARKSIEDFAGADTPKRIQRRRAKGWHKPDNAAIVDRTSIWGNPYVIGVDGDRDTVIAKYRDYLLHNQSC
jgi:hypothetical protein